MSRVRLVDVAFRYAEESAPALVVPSLRIEPGELVAVAGPVGAGATTLLLVAAGFAPRLTGGALSGARTLGAERPAIVFATPWTQLTGIARTVLAEVAFGPAAQGLSRAVVLDRSRQALARLGAAHLEARDPVSLSGGELQRVIVASALALEPDLLVLDDPAAELDPEGADRLYDLLAALAREGRTVLVATPDLERVARVATRALALERGRITADGAPRDVLGGTEVARMAAAAGCPGRPPLDVPGLLERVVR